MKSFIIFLKETDLNISQQYLVRQWTSGRELIPPRKDIDPDHIPIGVGSHQYRIFKGNQVSRGPRNIVDDGGEFGNAVDKYLKSDKHKLSQHIFDPNNADIPGSVHNGPVHSNTVRIIPFKPAKIEPHPDLIEHLNSHGYDIHDFEKGLAIKRGGKNPERIGKILKRTEPKDPDPNILPAEGDSPPNYTEHQREKISEAWKKWTIASHHFEQSREYHSLTDTHEIMISKDPYHIAEQSTGKKTWGSCIRLPSGSSSDSGGCNYPHLKTDILSGTHVAYLIPKGSYKPGQPLKAVARMTLRQYDNNIGEKHSVLRPAGSVYGFDSYHPVSIAFESALTSFTKKHFPFDPNRSRYSVQSTSPDGDEIYLDSQTNRILHNYGYTPSKSPNTNSSPSKSPNTNSSSVSRSKHQKLKGGVE